MTHNTEFENLKTMAANYVKKNFTGAVEDKLLIADHIGLYLNIAYQMGKNAKNTN